MKLKLSSRSIALILATILGTADLLVLVAAPVSAATLTNTYLRLNRMSAGQTTSFRLVFRTVSAGATSVAINFNGADATTWTGSSGVVNATQTVSSASCAAETGATALPGTLTASGSGSTVTVSGVTALSATTSYCVDLTSSTAVTNPTAGEYHPTVTAGSDSTTIALRTVSNDQIVVNATVSATFNFVISGCTSNIDNFTTGLSAGSVSSTTGCTITVNTNATNGWIAWARDSNTGLNSAAASHTIPSTTPGTNATLSAGTEGYVTGITSITQGSGAGTTTASNAYGNGAGGTAGAGQGSGLDANIRQIISSNGTASNASFVLREAAAISSLTPPANDYTDTITVIGAGNF